MKKFSALAVFLVVFFGLLVPSGADEGMWTLNNLPLKQLKEKYNFVPTKEWIDHVQLSSARLPNCSSSFVSSDGLIMTNGHCAEESVQALSTPGYNLYERGFYARTYAQELKTDRTLRVLIGMDDVTSRVNRYVEMYNDNDPMAARGRIIQNIQKEGSEILGLKCEVVILYQGGQYHLYCYKIYNDIRLVFYSEKNTWFFGGDADNFEYPRYAMDVAFFRVYENGKPVHTDHYFPFSKNGPRPEELLFVSGHPGRTERMFTSKALETERDVRVPFLLDLFRRREMTLQQFMLRGKEQHRIAESDLFSWQNSRKLYVGKIRGLQDPKLMENKIASEKKFFKDAYTNAVLSGKYANGLIEVGEAQEVIRQNYAKYMLLVRGLGFDSRLYDYAESIASGNKAYARSVLEARKNEPPLNLEYEEAKLRDSLTYFIEVFGADSEIVKGMPYHHSWGGPSELAHKYVYDTVISDVRSHYAVVEDMNNPDDDGDGMDPMIGLAEYVNSQTEKYEQFFKNALEQERRGYALLSDALFKAYGTDQYPDATFTLRLSFGKMFGYQENKKQISATTTIGGLYKHSAEFGNKGDYKLPARWLARKRFINLKTPLDFVSDLDITGGNSGSPVFNRNLEIVGIVFDSNIEGLVSDYDFNYAPNARAVAVHSSGILEVLRKIYRADNLVRELTRDQKKR